jgi:hypothetical protein
MKKINVVVSLRGSCACKTYENHIQRRKTLSRLSEILANHRNLEELLSLFKHHSVNAEFVAASVIGQFDLRASEETENNENMDTEIKGNNNPDLLEDLKQYCARL